MNMIEIHTPPESEPALDAAAAGYVRPELHQIVDGRGRTWTVGRSIADTCGLQYRIDPAIPIGEQLVGDGRRVVWTAGAWLSTHALLDSLRDGHRWAFFDSAEEAIAAVHRLHGRG